MKLNFLKKAVVLGAMLAALPAAFASPVTWDFRYTGTIYNVDTNVDEAVTVDAVLTTQDYLTNGYYFITAITGTRTTGADGGHALSLSDNLYGGLSAGALPSTKQYLDLIGFYYRDGSAEIEISYDDLTGSFDEFYEADDPASAYAIGSTTTTSVSITRRQSNGGGGAVPEPASIALVGLGLVGAAAVTRRRKSSTVLGTAAA